MDHDVIDAGTAWLAAEQAGDTEALDAALTEDFRAVGPVGFVLDRAGWIGRHTMQEHRVHYTAITWDDVAVTTHGDTAIAIGRQEQHGSVDGRPIDGVFRMTQVLRREGGRWLVASAHLSPIA